jgi:hypothetical protein
MGSQRFVRRAVALVGCTMLATAGVALAATPLGTGRYFGATSEHESVTFTVVSHGTALTNFKTTLGYNGKCGQGGGPGYNVNVARIAIPASGKFSKKTTLKLGSLHAPGQVSGTASGFKVTGKVVQFLNGKPNKCYTETFSAYPGQQQQH